MKVVLLILALLLAGVYFVAGRSSDGVRRGSAMLLMGVVVAILIQTVSSCRPEKIDYLRYFDEALAMALAAAAADAHPAGGEIAVLMPEDADADQRAGFFVESVRTSLAKVAAKTGVVFRECSSTGPPMGVNYLPPPLDLFDDAVGEFPDSTAIISFVGLPWASPSVGEGFPSMYVFEREQGPRLQAWMESGIVKGAVVLKKDYDSEARPRKSHDLAEVFDLRYSLLTP